jgi:hypothetical protein
VVKISPPFMEYEAVIGVEFMVSPVCGMIAI